MTLFGKRIALAIFAVAAVFFASSLRAQTLTTVTNNGASTNRVDMIFIGDGYQASEIESTYAGHVNDTVDAFFNSGVNPFPRYQNFFNVHRVNVISNESGADDPNNSIFVDTALDASYNTGGTDRCLYFNTGKANTAVNTALSGTGIDIDMRLGAVNSSKYGGCGGQWAVWSAGNGAARDISIHEVGHSFANLADEYFYNGDTWTGGEPGAVNITSDPSLGKWDRWLGYDDPDTNIGVIDYYEGGRYYDFGLYRPSVNSMMRALNRPFDAVGRERFIDEIYEEVDPLDNWLSDSETYTSGDSLWVDTVDPSVINVEWFVDGVSVGLLGENVDVNSLGLRIGTFSVEAFAYDSILDHSFSGDSLDWWRLDDTSSLEQSVVWNVLITVPEPNSLLLVSLLGLAVASRRRRQTTYFGFNRS